MSLHEQQSQQRRLLALVAVIAVVCLAHQCWTVDPVWTSRAITALAGIAVLVGIVMRIRSSRQISLLEITLLVPLLVALVIYPMRLVVENHRLRTLLDKSNVGYELVTDGYLASGLSRYATLLAGSRYRPVSTIFATKLYSMYINTSQLDESIFDLRLADAKHMTVYFSDEQEVNAGVADWLSTCSEDCNLNVGFYDMQAGQINAELGLVSAKISVARTSLGMSDLKSILQGEHQCLVLYDASMRDNIDYSALPTNPMEALVIGTARSSQFEAHDVVGLAKLVDPRLLELDVELALDDCTELAKLSRLRRLECHSVIGSVELEAICKCRTLEQLEVNASELTFEEQQAMQKKYPNIEFEFYEIR